MTVSSAASAASCGRQTLAVAAPAGAQQRTDPAADAAPGEYLVGFEPGMDKEKAVKDQNDLPTRAAVMDGEALVVLARCG